MSFHEIGSPGRSEFPRGFASGYRGRPAFSASLEILSEEWRGLAYPLETCLNRFVGSGEGTLGQT